MRRARYGGSRLLGVVALAAVILGARDGRACSVIGPEKLDIVPDPADTTAPKVTSANISFKRASDPGGSNADCSGLGSLSVVVDATDDTTDAKDLGYSLTLVKGSLPFTLPSGVVRDDSSFRRAGEFIAPIGDNGDAYDATVAVSMVDAAGNRSDPVEVHVSDEEVGGCSFSGRPASRSGLSLASALATLLLVVRRRTKRAA